MLTKTQLDILGELNLFKKYTFKEIKRLTNKKSNSIIQEAIKKLKQENLIKITRVGNVYQYSLDYNNKKLFKYLALYLDEKIEKYDKIVKEDISLIRKTLSEKEEFYSLIIFGSYATFKNIKNSDLDIAIIINKDKQKLEIIKKELIRKSITNLDIQIITKKEFLKMMESDYENLGKEIARKNLPIENINIFYELLIKGMKNGFTN